MFTLTQLMMLFRSVVAVLISAVGLLAVLPGTAAAQVDPIVRTQSGKMRCIVSANDVSHGGGPLVACRARFTNAPIWPQSTLNERMNIAVVRGNGAFKWEIGDIPGTTEVMAQDIVMTYGKTYRLNGWTIEPAFDGTRFTYDRTGHGMFASIDRVYSF
ncbi:hypothetical protein [Mycolicibacterium phlei]|uniref:hypothetical protein n=1 Tax=Mycolicibacterium phlei TaxID=1771 RepID=UPI000B0072F6|nr:hypothetical protein [Mycolicibacterium phlei]